MKCRGMSGRGGVSTASGRDNCLEGEGEGVLNDLSVIDPALFCLCRPPLDRPRAEPERAPREACLWIIRFVWTWSTGVGVGDRVLRAVAAAEADRFACEARLFRKACVAAIWAEAEAGVWGR